jgi:hypothetical protein
MKRHAQSAPWMLLVVACGSTEADSTSPLTDSGAPTRDGDPASFDGSVDAATATDAQGVDANGADPLSTDKTLFFGAPRCATSGFMFCEDFESKSAGDAPDSANWQISSYPAASTVKVEAAGARGSRSMRFEIGQGQAKAMMSLKRIFPIAGNAFWVRMFLRMNNLPLPFKYNDTRSAGRWLYQSRATYEHRWHGPPRSRHR